MCEKLPQRLGLNRSPALGQTAAQWPTLAVVGLFAVAWVAVDGLLMPPAFGHTDIYFFKDAGLNFAEGLGLTTRFTYGNPTFEYRDYATYPPIYPLVFGLYSVVLGISANSNQLFNSIVAALVGVIGFLALRPALNYSNFDRRLAVIPALGIISIAMGFFGPANDRPDGLAAALGMLALLLSIRRTTAASAIAAGAVCGLTLFTSPFAGMFTGLLMLIGVRAAYSPGSSRTGLAKLLGICIGGGATMLIALVLLRSRLPGWFDGFLGVASGSDTHNETGGGYFLALLRGDVRTWWSGFPYSRNIHGTALFQLGSVAAVLVARIVIDRRQHGASWQAWRLIPLAIVSPLCLITSPYQSHYPPIAAALLLAAWAGIESVRPNASPRTSAAALVLGFLCLVGFAAPGQAAAFLVRLGTRDSLQRTVGFLAEHRAAIKGSGVHFAVSPSNYIAWRQAGLHPLITAYTGLSVPANRSEVGFLALAYPGSGNLMLPQSLEFISGNEYVPVFRPKLPQIASLWGHQLSKSSQTWDSEIYARRACPRCLAVFQAAPHAARP